MGSRKYIDEADLINAAGIIKGFCGQHLCESCPFAIIFKFEQEKRISCKLRHIPKDWDLNEKGEENE